MILTLHLQSAKPKSVCACEEEEEERGAMCVRDAEHSLTLPGFVPSYEFFVFGLPETEVLNLFQYQYPASNPMPYSTTRDPVLGKTQPQCFSIFKMN